MTPTTLRLDRIECPADRLGARPIEGANPAGFATPEAGVLRTVPGTRAMPFGRQEVRMVFFGRVPAGLYTLN